MARQKKYAPLIQPKTPLETVIVLILLLPCCLWGYVKENPVQGTLVIAAIAGIIVFIVQRNKKKRAEYLKWFYNRERRIKELAGDAYIDIDLTNKISEAARAGKTVVCGKDFIHYNGMEYWWEMTNQSHRICVEGGDQISSQDKGEALSGKYGVSVNKGRDPIVFRCIGENQGGYVFYIFAETVLAFVEGPEKTVFLAAYSPKLIKLSYESVSKVISTVVQEKTQYDIRYYDKFNPIPDAAVIRSQWKVTNKDGSRSFKGGLLPQNNPLTFELLFTKIHFRIGNYYAAMSYSCDKDNPVNFVDDYEHFTSVWDKGLTHVWDDTAGETRESYYASMSSSTNYDSVVDEEEDSALDDSEEIAASAFSRTDAEINDQAPIEEKPYVVEEETAVEPQVAIASNPEPVNESSTEAKTPKSSTEPIIEEEKTEEELNIDGETESVRVRNREIAKKAVDALNRTYPDKYDFKTYQVRKPRENWNLQDAGVYTYVDDKEGNQYTIEFDLITDLKIHKSAVRFSIWGKTKELVAEKYKITVSKGKMNVNGDGYTVLIKRDYESMSEADISANFTKDCLTLMRLVSYDDPK